MNEKYLTFAKYFNSISYDENLYIHYNSVDVVL